MKSLISLLSIQIFCISFLLAQSPIIRQSSINAVFNNWQGEDMPGGAVGVFHQGELIYTQAFGKASLEYDIPNTVETIFNIASVSKQITAFSMVLLEQQGKLSLDDEIQDHLPEIPRFDQPITIRHLLHHTSGLRNFQNMLAMAGWRSGESMTNEDLLRYLSQQKELNFEPGAEYLYCNTGFNICTAIVERLSGMTFQEWTKKEIFEPLGMNNSSYREDLEVIHKNTATSYSGNKANGFRQPLKYWTYMGNGNVYTTIGDLAKWLENFRNPSLGGKAGIDLLVKPGVLNNGEEITYGLGIGVGKYRGLKRYSHGGSVGGYRSNMVYFPEKELGVIVLSNFSSASPQGKVMAIADMVLEGQFPEKKPVRTAPAGIPRMDIGRFPSTQFEDYVGDYYVDGVVVELTQKDGIGHIYAEGELPQPLPLKASSDSTFFVYGAPLEVMLTQTSGGYNIQIHYDGERNRGFKINKAALNAELLGSYYSPELDARYTFYVREDQLWVKHRRHDTFRLIPKSETALVGTAYFFADVKVEKDKKGKVQGIRVSNGRVRNLWFEKE